MKMMQGADFFPCSNMSRTRLAPTPTNISTKSEPLMEKNGTSASPAIARASKVLPVPGGPTRSTPFGMRPPSFWNFFGSRKNSTNSCTSSFASSTPATSRKVILFLSRASIRALDLPKLRAPLPAIRICCRNRKYRTRRKRAIGRKLSRVWAKRFDSVRMAG